MIRAGMSRTEKPDAAAAHARVKPAIPVRPVRAPDAKPARFRPCPCICAQIPARALFGASIVTF